MWGFLHDFLRDLKALSNLKVFLLGILRKNDSKQLTYQHIEERKSQVIVNNFVKNVILYNRSANHMLLFRVCTQGCGHKQSTNLVIFLL